MAGDGTGARSVGALAKTLEMVSPDLSPFLVQAAQAPGAGPGQAIHPNPCCGRRALGEEVWAILPEGELGAGPQAEGWAVDLSTAGAHDAGS